MTRVAYFCADPGVPVFGTKGSSVHVQEIVRAWRGTGADVTVYCARRGTDRPADLADLDVVEVTPKSATAGAAREQAIEDAALALVDEVLHRGCGLIYERYSLFSPALSVLAPVLDIPSVLEINAPLIEEQQRYRQLVDVKKAETVLRRNARTADVVACVSEPVVRWVLQRVPSARTVLVPNGVNIHRITPRQPGRRSPNHLTVAFVGTLKPWHGVPGLLHGVALANAQTPDPANRWRALVIGNGPVREDLERLAATLGVEARFTGAVPPDAVPGLLDDADAGAAPYPADVAGQDDYFSPLKVYEYMAAALPIIASAVGQIPSILEHGRTGILVPPGEPAAVAEALILLAGDPALRERLGTSARADAEQHFSWDGVLTRITHCLPPIRRAATQ
ncbi:glycosyltransferase family 4 protein [Pseudarthrobacter sp. MM222]|uniref:glycosyltransferase family 4 protein n=1 Tax=Pseudarthrobacter sp. MM222 TaxID=3018929 RepID=UPI00221EEE99|nr:glycosyltransferase family 4 protein [Pseudarthrobacter sp. MM222]CAI3804464.1 D-inositol-3-phosphate glycosyltransferase [Pseudarthrobacter sp. MM222]